MRRSDRGVTDPAGLAAILSRGMVCQVAFLGEPYPYVVPLNYGFEREDGQFILYFHGAGEGEKVDRMRRDPHVAFCVLGGHSVFGREDGCSYSMAYESVMGEGIFKEVAPEKKAHALTALMRQVAPDKRFSFTEAELSAVAVWQLEVQTITGKRRAGPTA